MKTFICKNCGARFTGKDIVSINSGSNFECPKCRKKNAELFEEKGLKRKKWKLLGNFIKDGGF